MTDFRKLLNTLETLDEELMEVNDSFDLEVNDELVIETGIVGFTEDGVILEADEKALELLTTNGALLNEEIDWSKYDEPTVDRIKKGETKPVDRTDYDVPPGMRKDTKGKTGPELRREKLQKMGSLKEADLTPADEERKRKIQDMIKMQKAMGNDKAVAELEGILNKEFPDHVQEGVAEDSKEKDPVWNKGTPMPKDYTCHCGLYVHPSRRNPKAIHISDCPYAPKQDKKQGKKQSVAEGRFDEPLTGWHIVSKAHGQVVRGTPSFETKEQAQKYLMTKMFANHQDYEVVHTGGVTEGYKNTFSNEPQQGVAEGKSEKSKLDLARTLYAQTYAKNAKTVKHAKEAEKAAYAAVEKKYGNEVLAALKKHHDSNDHVKEGKQLIDEAEYQGRKVPLGKPMQGDVAKFKVYVKKPNGKVVKVNFGDKNMRIKKSNPARRKSFRARHRCENPGPRWKARYWSCRKW